jgi:arylsulfatase
MKVIKLICFAIIAFIALGACTNDNATGDAGGEKYGQEFKGKISKTYEESEEAWPEKIRPPEGSPNVIIFLLDDVGFAQVGSFGGLIETPNIDKLGANGLRYNNFHTTALCSPSRATLWPVVIRI